MGPIRSRMCLVFSSCITWVSMVLLLTGSSLLTSRWTLHSDPLLSSRYEPPPPLVGATAASAEVAATCGCFPSVPPHELHLIQATTGTTQPAAHCFFSLSTTHGTSPLRMCCVPATADRPSCPTSRCPFFNQRQRHCSAHPSPAIRQSHSPTWPIKDYQTLHLTSPIDPFVPGATFGRTPPCFLRHRLCRRGSGITSRWPAHRRPPSITDPHTRFHLGPTCSELVLCSPLALSCLHTNGAIQRPGNVQSLLREMLAHIRECSPKTISRIEAAAAPAPALHSPTVGSSTSAGRSQPRLLCTAHAPKSDAYQIDVCTIRIRLQFSSPIIVCLPRTSLR